jgi:hypothetical protein
MAHGAVTGSLYPLTYGIVGLITSVCLILIGLITVNITSQLRKQVLNLFHGQNNRVETAPVPLHRMNTGGGHIGNVTTTQKSNQPNTS